MSRNADTIYHDARSGTRTETTDPQSQLSEQGLERQQITGTLRLRGYQTDTNTQRTEGRHIRWAEDVVDNEGQGKKSSKVCCIYHRPRAAGEDSSESDSDSSSSSDSDYDRGSERDNGEARMTRGTASGRGRHNCPEHDHAHNHHDNNHDENADQSSRQPKSKKRPPRKPAPNAYERFPEYSKKPHSKT